MEPHHLVVFTLDLQCSASDKEWVDIVVDDLKPKIIESLIMLKASERQTRCSVMILIGDTRPQVLCLDLDPSEIRIDIIFRSMAALMNRI